MAEEFNSVIDDYLNELVLGQDDEIRELGEGEEFTTDETVDEEIADGNWMQQNAPEWFSDWLYEAERSDLGDLDLSSDFGEISSDDISVMPSDAFGDRLSDAARAAIQTGAYMGDFWKDLGMLPYNLATGQEKPFARLFEQPEWAQDIGYESDYGQAVMEDPRIRWIQENLLPYAGPGFFAKTGLSGVLGISKQIDKIPGLRKGLEMIYPTTMKGFKKGLMPRFGIGNIPVNVGIPYLWNQIGRHVKGKQTDYDKGMEWWMSNNTDFSPVSPAYASTPNLSDSDPVVFDQYMQDKLANFEPSPKDPGPRNNYQGL
tara:strand:- start:13 stop:957 length:945 start_codon:yes stop_codon:yes gene_type:complete